MYEKLIESFMQRNAKINLSSFNDAESIESKHIQDSLFGVKIIENLPIPSNAKIVDIWTWWGFPILPLAIEFPNFKFTWIESVKKKTIAVNSIIQELKLQNIEIIRDRAENYDRGKFDVLTARAVSYVDKLLNFSYHLVKNGGFFVFYKLDSEQERDDLTKLCKKYKLDLKTEFSYKLSNTDKPRIIYVLQKL